VSSAIDVNRNALRGSLARAAGFFGFWLVLSGFSPINFLVGALAAAVAAPTLRVASRCSPASSSIWTATSLKSTMLWKKATAKGRSAVAPRPVDKQRRNRADLTAERVRKGKALAALEVQKAPSMASAAPLRPISGR
jgi:hypothetical protein